MKASDWIPLSKQTPLDGELVLLISPERAFKMWSTGWCNSMQFIDGCTHWMPFTPPEPDDGFENFWCRVSQPSGCEVGMICNDFIKKFQAKTIWQAAQAAVKGEKV